MVRSKYKKTVDLTIYLYHLKYLYVSSEIPVHVFVDHIVQSSDIGLSYRVDNWRVITISIKVFKSN